jgi:hypothetical protein
MPTSGEVPLSLDLGRVNQLTASRTDDGSVELRTTGTDPYILFEPFERSQPGDDEFVLAFEYFCPDGIDGVDVYYGPPITAENFLSAGSLRKAEGWQPFSVNLRDASSGRWTKQFNQLRIDPGKLAGRMIRIRNVVLREPNEAERRSQAERDAVRARKQANADIVTDYLAATKPVKIESVAVDGEQIRIAGRTDGETFGALSLIEAPPWQELWKGDIPVAPISQLPTPYSETSQSRLIPQRGTATIQLEGNRFTVSVPRFDGERDRITSRWGVVARADDGSLKLLSHYLYPTDLRAACVHPELDRKTAAGIKGMGGVWPNDILDELVELGVEHITDNIWISSRFSGAPREGWMEFSHNGRTWWVQPAFVREQDRLIKFATDHGMVVSAIILVGFGDNGFAGALQHPDADRAGNYAMPNLTTAEGVAAYEAAIYFLAERYAQPGDPYGRISNWILHNEVDYGWVWTNMGEQPMPVYLDTYVRSMRIVHNIARQFNPHARTFISLTHHWHKENDPAWKTYAPKAMLQMLAEFSRVEGDFEGGAAYHPYPQSLFKPDAWNDTNVTDDFATPLITPKNVAVLDRWMQRGELLFRQSVGSDASRRPHTNHTTTQSSQTIETDDTPGGALGESRPTIPWKVRGVLFSEQGFHTNDYSKESERLQGAAFIYMWRQMRGLKTIEAFHNHRWVDHPAEGGLKLGVRRLPSEGKPYGERKFGWEVYKALDTPGEPAFAEELDPLNSGE